jgi:hypothetical protein
VIASKYWKEKENLKFFCRGFRAPASNNITIEQAISKVGL